MSNYEYLTGMDISYSSGSLEREEYPEEARGSGLRYNVKFVLSLDFESFKSAANRHIPNYLDSGLNAIRPELKGLGYHTSYDYFAYDAGKIRSSAELYPVFTKAESYFDAWSDEELLSTRYSRPTFTLEKETLIITAAQHFRNSDGTDLTTENLPIILFDWSLNVMQGHNKAEAKAPISKAILAYTQDESVTVEGKSVRKGTKYIVGSQLNVGSIPGNKVLTA